MPAALEVLNPAADPPTLAIAFALARVPAGFPSPADDHLEAPLDLNEHLIKHPAATFIVRASGDSMRDAGIHDGDLLIVDRSLSPRNGSIVVACVDGELTVKRLQKCGGRPYLTPENPAYPALWIDAGSTFEVWGVVTNCIHRLH
ncbi:MAG: translesion error-prone DNA polymerase V autoproteolytic subunit [Planctomycetota bacterium]|nr:translesion error-prone DNA polymerase V autoproteolytic subunit [Planctomycetota bacterium]